MPASFKQAFTGPMVRSKRSSVSCSILARVSVFWMCFGPLASAVMNGRLMSYVLRAGEGDLGFLGFFLDALERVGLLAQIHAGSLV